MARALLSGGIFTLTFLESRVTIDKPLTFSSLRFVVYEMALLTFSQGSYLVCKRKYLKVLHGHRILFRPQVGVFISIPVYVFAEQNRLVLTVPSCHCQKLTGSDFSSVKAVLGKSSKVCVKSVLEKTKEGGEGREAKIIKQITKQFMLGLRCWQLALPF